MDGRELSKLRDKFIEDNPDLGDATTLRPLPGHRQYLENRLRRAFEAGAKAMEELMKKKPKEVRR